MFLILLLILNVHLLIHQIIVLNTFYYYSVLETELDKNASQFTEKPAMRCARILVHISELLAAQKADGIRALRSGPSSNSYWLPALDLLRKGDTKSGVEQMIKLRKSWSHAKVSYGVFPDGIPDTIRRIRAARHLEAAAQILVMQAFKRPPQMRDFFEIGISDISEV